MKKTILSLLALLLTSWTAPPLWGADVKITELPEATSVVSTDVIPVVVNPGSSPVTKKVTLQNLGSAIGVSTPTEYDNGTCTTALASESLTNGALTSGTSWARTDDMALSSNAATYTHSTGAGTLTQASASLAIALKSNTWYTLTYDVSSVTAGCTATVLSVGTLDITAGTGKTLTFLTGSSVTDFIISVTSSAGGFTLDNLSFKEITAAKTIDSANGSSQKMDLSANSNCALTFTQPGSGTAKIMLKITQNGTTATGGIMKNASGQPLFPGGTVPTITPTVSAIDILSCYLDGTNTYCMAAQSFQ